jgi:glycosyltransferase involved in cell wall biosynthesis
MSNVRAAVTGDSEETPRFSVIIPTHNRRHLVSAAIESVLAQEPFGATLELIVVDDGSSDGTSEVIARYPQAKYVRSEAKNLSLARNSGMAVARGEWLAFLDDDDVWLPHKMQRIVESIAQHPEARILLSEAYSCDAELNPTWIWRPPASAPNGGRYRTFLENVMTPSALVVHRSVFERVGPFDANAYRSEDREFYLRSARAGVPFLNIDEPLILYRRPVRIDGDKMVATLHSTLDMLRREFRYRHPEQPSLLRQKAYELNVRRWYTKSLLEGFREQTRDGNAREARRLDAMAFQVSPLHWVYHRVLRRNQPARAFFDPAVANARR